MKEQMKPKVSKEYNETIKRSDQTPSNLKENEQQENKPGQKLSTVPLQNSHIEC